MSETLMIVSAAGFFLSSVAATLASRAYRYRPTSFRKDVISPQESDNRKYLNEVIDRPDLIDAFRLFDNIKDAVAIFEQKGFFVYCNAAYRNMWEIDQDFLDKKPNYEALIDHLHERHMLPDAIEYVAWKRNLIVEHKNTKAYKDVWHLPDGRTLHMSVGSTLQGGVFHIFEDFTESNQRESYFLEQIRSQNELIYSIKDAVSLFSSDGYLKLYNRAFATMWNFSDEYLQNRPHLNEIKHQWDLQTISPTNWSEVDNVIMYGRGKRSLSGVVVTHHNGSTLNYSVKSLTSGDALLTFTDITSSVNVERVLKEEKEFLISAEKLRSDFVQHISYELRSSLTNVIGFSQLIGDRSIGLLNQKQTQYLGYITLSSSSLLALINDILDLSTIDDDSMELEIEAIDIKQTVEEAVVGIQDRIAENNIHLRIIVSDSIGSFYADRKRLRQILFNLLSNAVGFSTPGQTVTIAALRREKDVVFKVSDQGRGIPFRMVDRVFDRFSSDVSESRHRGFGLGLSISRSIVKMHGGNIEIESGANGGTIVTVTLPDNRKFHQRFDQKLVG